MELCSTAFQRVKTRLMEKEIEIIEFIANKGIDSLQQTQIF